VSDFKNVPYADNFLIAAQKVNQVEAMAHLLRRHESQFPNKTLRYNFIFEVGAHASKKRGFLFDGATGAVEEFHVAHGSGSEGDKNDGWATQFSNIEGSRQTSLGIYVCGIPVGSGTYNGKHGRSMYLDGIDSTNSNARSRAVVMHGADYVKETGAEAGDSWGCPALANDVVQKVIDCLQGGSLLYIYVRKNMGAGNQSIETLKKGSVGPVVIQLQQALGIAQDGYFGSITELAVKSFQSLKGLKSDGVVGPKTWAELAKHGVGQIPVETPQTPAPQKGNEKLLYWPKALIRKDLKKKGKGPYRSKSGLSVGSIVHFTAGNYKKGKQNAIDSISGSPFNFHCIGYDGTFVQANPLNEWGRHAGESQWKINGRVVAEVSDYLDGIEINNPGKLTEKNGKYYAYFDLKNPIDPSLVRVIKKDKHNVQKGAYLKYSPEQEKTLVEYLLWRKFNDPENYSFDYVLGHDEVAGDTLEDDASKGYGLNKDRKNDPGGALSMTMPEFREHLKAEYARIYGV
jgi:N-acetyl-anhydromuramyl-L-alanine amidase AmpD